MHHSHCHRLQQSENKRRKNRLRNSNRDDADSLRPGAAGVAVTREAAAAETARWRGTVVQL
jgi:hypothetical protein